MTKMTRQNKSRQKKKDNERTHEPTSGTYPLVCCPHHSHLHSSSCYKSFPPKDPHLSLLLVPAHSAPLTRSGKKWTNDHSISPANAFHFFVTSISESVIFLQDGGDGTYPTMRLAGWLHHRGRGGRKAALKETVTSMRPVDWDRLECLSGFKQN